MQYELPFVPHDPRDISHYCFTHDNFFMNYCAGCDDDRHVEFLNTSAGA